MTKTLSLYELNSIVASVIDIDMQGDYWVVAEISELREVRGHCYMELVEKDELSNTPIAKPLPSAGLHDGACSDLCSSASPDNACMPE